MCSGVSDLIPDMNVSVTNPYYPQNNIWDNPEDILSLQTVKVVEKITHCGFANVHFLIGAPANLLTMIIFYRQGLRDRMNLCLFCLAFIDLMYLTTLFAMGFYCFLAIAYPDRKEFWKWVLVKHGINFMYAFAHSSGCLTMIIAVERCVCVMFPMKAASMFSTKTMTILLFVMFIVIQLLCSVYIIKEQITIVKDVVTGQNVIFLTNTELFLHNNAFKIIENIVLSFVSFFNFTVVILATAVTVVKLRNAMIWRKSTASSYLKGQALLMRMLVTVSFIYILCTSPNIVLALARFAVPEFRAEGRYSNIFLTTHVFSQIPLMFNSSINFFVYAKMSSRFRQELRLLFVPAKSVITSQSTVVNSTGSKIKQ